MRILYITRKFPRLEETFVLNEILFLLRRGHEVMLCGPENVGESVRHPEVVTCSLQGRRIEPPGPAGEPPPFDLLHCTFADEGCLRIAEWFLSRGRCLPLTVTCRSPDIYCSRGGPSVVRFQHVLRQAAALITVSRYCQVELVRLVAPRCPVYRIHSSIDVQFFTRSRPRNPNRIVSVARFSKEKGLEELIRAFRLLGGRAAGCHAVLVGRGGDEAGYRTLIGPPHRLPLKLVGPQPRDGIREELDRGGIFVLPCVITPDGTRDALPNAIKEAMAMELPVITSDICGIEELVEDGVHGFLVPPRCPAALARAIRRLRAAPRLCSRMGRAGRQRIAAEFNIEIEGGKLEEVFKEAVQRVGNGADKKSPYGEWPVT